MRTIQKFILHFPCELHFMIPRIVSRIPDNEWGRCGRSKIPTLFHLSRNNGSRQPLSMAAKALGWKNDNEFYMDGSNWEHLDTVIKINLTKKIWSGIT